MVKVFRLIVLFLLLAAVSRASEDVLRFRVYLTDKHGVIPTFFNVALSPESINRRECQGIALDSTDLPIYEGYIDSLQTHGFKIVTSSKWMNTVVVSVADSSKLEALSEFEFVQSYVLVWVNPSANNTFLTRKVKRKSKFQTDTLSIYGTSRTQVEMLGLEALHQAGFKGSGLTIALLDAGFRGVDTLAFFRSVSIKDARDFIYPPSDVYQGHSHGTSVLSLMAAKEPYQIVGTAPEASYCLYRTEDVLTEFPIEEDYWAAAAECADSIGVNIINSSLGYTEFDIPSLSYTKSQMDGKTAFVTQAASMASQKGILVCVSAGNDGENSWRKIGAPSDAAGVLCVGSVQSDLIRSTFSSIGPTADGRIKPDVMAMGHYVSYVTELGSISNGYGTSFSSPLIAGMAACIWDALPELTAVGLRDRIVESGNQFDKPDSLYGYGIPNAQKVYLSVQQNLKNNIRDEFFCYYSSKTGFLYISDFIPNTKSAQVYIYNTFGVKVMEQTLQGHVASVDLRHLPNSIYLIDFIVSGIRKSSKKFLLQR